MRYLSVLCFLLISFSCIGKQASSERKRIFYVDADSGSDANSGHSPELEWAGLEKVNETIYQSGDQILFNAGTKYKGQLVLNGSGNQNHPIMVDKYGDGARPLIEAEGNFSEALIIKNLKFWNVQNLECTNSGIIK